MSGQPRIGRRVLSTVCSALLCAVSLSAALPSASTAATAKQVRPADCAGTPMWIESATVLDEGQNPLPSCFSDASDQAEAVLSIANNRPYAQLITVSGAMLDLAESSFDGLLEQTLSRLLASSPSPTGATAFLLGPGQRASLAIDRSAPGPAQIVHIDPAPDNAFAVAALAWAVLSAAEQYLSLPRAIESCIAAAVRGGLSTPPSPERALRRIHACVNQSSGAPRALLQALAARLLRNDSFRKVIHREGTESHPARIAYAVSASNPNLPNPAILLGLASLGTLPGDRLSVRHLSASGGTPPYRFYLVPEPGGPAVPAWVHLAADGTLMLEPPAGTTSVAVPVEVVDSNGEHSVVAD